MTGGYAFHPEAKIDLDAVWEYIAEDNPEAADRIIDAIEATIQALVPFPHQGHRRPDLTSRPLRFTNVGNYLIAYAPDKSPPWIVAVMHGRRSPRVMAAILRKSIGTERNPKSVIMKYGCYDSSVEMDFPSSSLQYVHSDRHRMRSQGAVFSLPLKGILLPIFTLSRAVAR
jgi:plasmid stabilization system protein ParE